MIIDRGEHQQDTLKLNNPLIQDSLSFKADSSLKPIPVLLKDTLHPRILKAVAQKPIAIIDTTSVCTRNSISDITFFDSSNFILDRRVITSDNFPVIFTEKTRQMNDRAIAEITQHLRQGKNLPLKPLHEDWITGILILAAFLFAMVQAASKNMAPQLARFFLFRGINDSSSRDVAGIFNWQSTILNLISFIVLSLFIYSAAVWYGVVPEKYPGIMLWLIITGIVIAAVTIRHFICYLAGGLSGENDVFREYLHGVYQSYQYSAIFLFILIFLISYTVFFPSNTGFITGAVLIGLIYLFRVFRLLIIFLNRNISIFYLILYLCALEVLPVLISVKYLTGLI